MLHLLLTLERTRTRAVLRAPIHASSHIITNYPSSLSRRCAIGGIASRQRSQARRNVLRHNRCVCGRRLTRAERSCSSAYHCCRLSGCAGWAVDRRKGKKRGSDGRKNEWLWAVRHVTGLGLGVVRSCDVVFRKGKPSLITTRG